MHSVFFKINSKTLFLSVYYRGIFLRVSLYFGEPVGRVKIQEKKYKYIAILHT